MSYPNTLGSEFYSSVFGWEIEPRPGGVPPLPWTKGGGDPQIPDGWTGE